MSVDNREQPNRTHFVFAYLQNVGSAQIFEQIDNEPYSSAYQKTCDQRDGRTTSNGE